MDFSAILRRRPREVDEEQEKFVEEFSNISQKLPFAIRLYIIQYLHFRKRFYIQGKEFIYTSNRRPCSTSQYIKFIYGYFTNDRWRKPYLFRSKISYTVLGNSEPFDIGDVLPRKRLRTIVLSGSLENVEFDKFPDCVEKIVFTSEVTENQLLTAIKRCKRVIHLKLYQGELFDSEELFSQMRKIDTVRLDYTKPNPKNLFSSECKWNTRNLWCNRMEHTKMFPRLRCLRTQFANADQMIFVCAEMPHLEVLECVNGKYGENWLRALIYVVKCTKIRKLCFLDEFDFSVITLGDWKKELPEKSSVRTIGIIQEMPEEVGTVLEELGIKIVKLEFE